MEWELNTFLKIHFSRVCEIYVATREVNQSDADCTPMYLLKGLCSAVAMSKTTV